MTTSNSEETIVVAAWVLGVSQEPLDKIFVLRLVLLPYGKPLGSKLLPYSEPLEGASGIWWEDFQLLEHVPQGDVLYLRLPGRKQFHLFAYSILLCYSSTSPVQEN